MSRLTRALAVLVGGALAAASGGCLPQQVPQRLPGQDHNLMLYVKTEGKGDLHIPMPAHWDLGSPSISPDGKTIAFDALTVGDEPMRESWVVGVAGRGLRKLADGATPRWSPDGGRLLITRDDNRNPLIFEVTFSGGREQELCPGRLADYSPDGKRIALSRKGTLNKSGGTHAGAKLLIVQADGGNPQELGDGEWPSWSPDGKKIAYCVDNGRAPPFLWIIDVATKDRVMLGMGLYRPQWAGDGKSVVCNGLKLLPDGKAHRLPARFRLDKLLEPEFFLTELDTPFSPCVSRDGKTMVVVVDSEGRGKASPAPPPPPAKNGA